MRGCRYAPGALLLLLAGALPAAMAQTLPDLGGTVAGPLSPQVERRIGESIVRDIRYRDPAYVDDPEITEYLNNLGGRLVAASPGARTDFEFLAVRDPVINAFALPGGFVVVNTGLLQATDTESELASVLAHEIAHVTQRHISRLLSAQEQVQKLQLPAMIALVAAGLASGRPDLVAGAAAAVQAGGIQAQLHYTRQFEAEADRIGFQTLVNAGFDPNGMGAFFEKLQRYSRVSDDGTVPGYLRDHPVTAERIADAENRAAKLPYRQHPDSIEFQLVRAKLRAELGYAQDAVDHFTSVVRERRYASELAARYGLSTALLRAGRVQDAAREFARLHALGTSSPMLDTLDARIRVAGGDIDGALAVLKSAVDRYSRGKSLVYAYAGLLLQAARYRDADAFIDRNLQLYPHDAQLLSLRARTYEALGKRLLQHQAQAEVYVLRGSLPAAIEQLQLARAAGDGDFYELSEVEARLRELRAQHAEELRDKPDKP